MQITAQMVSQLREQTGAGMMECKKALTEAEGDLEKARDILRARGQAGAEKRAGRAAAEGVVAANLGHQAAAMVELNCETDFVARNEEFMHLARDIAHAAAHVNSANLDEVMAQSSGGATLQQRLEDARAKLRENIVLRRVQVFAAQPDSVLADYIHRVNHKTGVLVELKGDTRNEEQKELARGIAMHVAANKPEYLRREDVPADVLERERQVLAEKTRNEGKPEAAIPKIVEGRLNKFYEQVCLVEQPYVRDPSKKIGDLAKGLGAEVRRFTLYQVGQG